MWCDLIVAAPVPSLGAYSPACCARLPKPATPVVDALAARGVLGGIPVSRFYPARADLADLLLVAATETVIPEDIDRLADGLREVLR